MSALESIHIPASVTALENGYFAASVYCYGVLIINNTLVSVAFESGSQLRKI
jgi:hypothetical protein